METIPQEMVDEIVEHAELDMPNECCGLIGAVDGKPSTLYQAKNAAEFKLAAYEMDPMDEFNILQTMEAKGEQLWAIYHSHPNMPGIPSTVDTWLSRNWPDPLYIICGVDEKGDREVRAWHIFGEEWDEVEEVELQEA